MSVKADENIIQPNIQKPAYILGYTPLGCYLAAKFMQAGENTVLISAAGDAKSEISIREEHSLKKNKFNLNISSHSRQEAKILIITSDAFNLRSELMRLSPAHFYNCPVVVFSHLAVYKDIESILSHNTVRANFDGWINNKDKQISILGSEPLVTLSKPFNTLEFSLKALSVFHSAGILCQTADDKNQVFWDGFAVFAASCLLTRHYNQNLFNILKNKDRQEEASLLLKEIALLSAAENIKIDTDALLKKLYNTPISWLSPLQTLSPAAARDAETIRTVISDISHKYKIEIPILKRLLK